MAKRKYTYNKDCEYLAVSCLIGQRIDEAHLWSLAQTIQDAIDAWLYDNGFPSVNEYTLNGIGSPASAYDTLPSDCEPREPSEALPSNENVNTTEGE